MLGLILGKLNFLWSLTGLGSNLSTGFDVLTDFLDSEPDESLLRSLEDSLDSGPDDSEMCSWQVSFLVVWLFFGSGFAIFSLLDFELVLLLGSTRLFLRSIHGSSSD